MCYVVDCTNTGEKKSKQFSFYQIPKPNGDNKSKKLTTKWLHNIGRGDKARSGLPIQFAQ